MMLWIILRSGSTILKDGDDVYLKGPNGKYKYPDDIKHRIWYGTVHIYGRDAIMSGDVCPY